MAAADIVIDVVTALAAAYGLFALAIATTRLSELGQMLRRPVRAAAFCCGLAVIASLVGFLCVQWATSIVEYTWFVLLALGLALMDVKLVVDTRLRPSAVGLPTAAGLMLQHKVAIVTGSNSGIGYSTAKALAELGAVVLVACRSLEKAEVAASAINATLPPGGTGKAVPMKLDLESFGGVRRFAQAFKEQFSDLHVLVNNAGMLPSHAARTADGFESGIGVMHFAHFLLSELLRDYLEVPSADGFTKRVINVASAAHLAASVHPSLLQGNGEGDLRGEVTTGGVSSYARAKLCNILMTYEQQRRWQAAGVTAVVAHTLHPGSVITAIWDALPCPVRMLFKPIAKLLYRSPDQAASLICFLVADGAMGTIGGQYLHGGLAPALSSPLSRDTQLAARLWQISERFVSEDV